MYFLWSLSLRPPLVCGKRGARRTVELLKGPTRRRHPLFGRKRLLCAKTVYRTMSLWKVIFSECFVIFAYLSSCKCFNSLSSSSRLKFETSQRSMSRSAETFSSSARNRTTSPVRSIVAIPTTSDNHYEHSTSLITSKPGG